MFGMGAIELGVIVVLAVLLFGGPVLTFLLGYALGQKKVAPTARMEPPAATDPQPPAVEIHEETTPDE